MNIVMLNGQNHRGSTYWTAKQIADRIPGENETEEFFFPKDLGRFCLGCYRCLKGEENCPYHEEKLPLLKAVEKADLIIVTTPTYCMHVSAPLKAVIELTFGYWMSHRPQKCMFSKRALVVSTAAGTGTKSAMKDVCDALFYLGVPEVIKYGVSVQAMDPDGIPEKIKEKIGRDAEKIAARLGRSGKPSPGIRQKFMFNMMRLMQKKGWGSGESEKAYWEQTGWLGSGRPWKE